MSEIVGIQARQILDSRGNPTVEVDVFLEEGLMGRAAVPSGASTGSREALEMRDGDKKSYMGKGVQKAVKNVNTKIAPELVGIEVTEQRPIDQIMIELMAAPTRASWAPTRFWVCRWRWRMRRRTISMCRCSATSAAATRVSCRCR